MLFIVPLNWCWWTRVWLVRFPNPLGSWGTWPRSDWERIPFFRIQEYLSEEGGKGNRSGKNKDSLVLFFINHDYILFFHIWISWKLLFPTMPHHILLLGQAWGEDESKTWGKLGGGWKAAASQGSGDMMMIIKLFVSSLSRLISKQKSRKA